MTETPVQAEIWLDVGSDPTVRLFRNNCGLLYDRNGRPVKYGIANPGGSDLIGFRSIVVTPEMVGQTVAVFSALEIKTPEWRPRNAADKLRWEQQQKFVGMVREFGGIAGVVRSPAEARRVMRLPPRSGR